MEFTLERNDALNFLQGNPLGALATLNREGLPDVSAIYFFTEKDFTCYFVTKSDTRKYQNCLKNPNVTLLSFSEKDLISVEINGTVETVVDTLEVARSVERFQDRVSTRKAGYWIPPISQLKAGSYVVCKLIPTVIRFNNFAANIQDPSVPVQVIFKP